MNRNYVLTICRTLISRCLRALACPFYLLAVFVSALFVGFSKQPASKRLVWGSVPIINNSHWSRAMRAAGFNSVTYTDGYYQINDRGDWDLILSEQYSWLPVTIRPYVAFLVAIFKYDIFFISIDGFFIGRGSLWWIQSPILKLAKKKVVVIPYGGDAFIYRRVRSPSVVHGLLSSYPLAARQQAAISRRVDYWVARADFVIPANMGCDGFGRWDVLIHLCLFLGLDDWKPSVRSNFSNGIDGVVVIAHTPNHRGFKGTEFVISAVKKLQEEGLKVELLLFEGVSNEKVRGALQSDVDILVEQLIFTGHALSSLEGMASALPVISNLEDGASLEVFRRYSYFKECPLISASPENIADVLRVLVLSPKLREELGRAGRKYVERYHSTSVAQKLFADIVSYLSGDRGSLINYFDPLKGEFRAEGEAVVSPLVNNRLPD